jgi:hypothetical protein
LASAQVGLPGRRGGSYVDAKVNRRLRPPQTLPSSRTTFAMMIGSAIAEETVGGRMHLQVEFFEVWAYTGYGTLVVVFVVEPPKAGAREAR